jgi:hypothetical protein
MIAASWQPEHMTIGFTSTTACKRQPFQAVAPVCGLSPSPPLAGERVGVRGALGLGASIHRFSASVLGFDAFVLMSLDLDATSRRQYPVCVRPAP